MALLENNEFKGDDEEQSSDSLDILQKEMDFLMQCLAVCKCCKCSGCKLVRVMMEAW